MFMFIRNSSRACIGLAVCAMLLPPLVMAANPVSSSNPSVRGFKALLEHPPQTGSARFLYKTPANPGPLEYEAAWHGSDYFLAATGVSHTSGCWESNQWSYANGNIAYVEMTSESRRATGTGGDVLIRDLLTLGIQGLKSDSLRWTANGFVASRADGMPITGRLLATNNVVQAVECNLGPGPGMPWLRVEYTYAPTNAMPRRIVAYKFVPGNSQKKLFFEDEIKEWKGTLSAEEWAQYAPETRFPAAKVINLTKSGLVLEKRGSNTVLLNPPRRKKSPSIIPLRAVLLLVVIGGAAAIFVLLGRKARNK